MCPVARLKGDLRKDAEWNMTRAICASYAGEARQADRDLQVMFAHCNNPVPDPLSVVPGLPEGCAAVVSKAMAKAPADRYQSAREMLAALEAVLARTPVADLPSPEPQEARRAPPEIDRQRRTGRPRQRGLGAGRVPRGSQWQRDEPPALGCIQVTHQLEGFLQGRGVTGAVEEGAIRCGGHRLEPGPKSTRLDPARIAA